MEDVVVPQSGATRHEPFLVCIALYHALLHVSHLCMRLCKLAGASAAGVASSPLDLQ